MGGQKEVEENVLDALQQQKLKRMLRKSVKMLT
jgi:hypothetical protein